MRSGFGLTWKFETRLERLAVKVKHQLIGQRACGEISLLLVPQTIKLECLSLASLFSQVQPIFEGMRLPKWSNSNRMLKSLPTMFLLGRKVSTWTNTLTQLSRALSMKEKKRFTKSTPGCLSAFTCTNSRKVFNRKRWMKREKFYLKSAEKLQSNVKETLLSERNLSRVYPMNKCIII